MRLALIFVAATAALSGAATADEVWSTPYGEAVYEADVGDIAVIRFPLYEDSWASLYLPGFAGNVDQRATHDGFWIGDDDGYCLSTMNGPDKKTSSSWGQATIVFHDMDFPSGWTLITGDCFAPLFQTLLAEPVLGE